MAKAGKGKKSAKKTVVVNKNDKAALKQGYQHQKGAKEK